MDLWARLPLTLSGLLLAACAQVLPVPLAADADVLLLGEQHDAADHPERHRQVVQALASQGRLAALALEMAERGASTAGLPADAPESSVQAALGWNSQAWPWPQYRPAVMAAVAARVPVIGANMPRSAQRPAMADAALDALLSAAALESQRQAIRDGHCGLLPEAQIAPMTRIQIARDRAMAQTLAQAAVPGKTVVLLAGAGHVLPDLGVPLHLPAGLRAQSISHPPQPSGVDHCARLREQFRPRAAP